MKKLKVSLYTSHMTYRSIKHNAFNYIMSAYITFTKCVRHVFKYLIRHIPTKTSNFRHVYCITYIDVNSFLLSDVWNLWMSSIFSRRLLILACRHLFIKCIYTKQTSSKRIFSWFCSVSVRCKFVNRPRAVSSKRSRLALD